MSGTYYGLCTIPTFDCQEDLGVTIKNTRTQERIQTDTLHVSCKSDKFDAHKNMAGMVIWQYGGKTDWRLNGVHCKSGYIYVRHTENIQSIKSSQGQVHGKLFKALFGVEPGEDVVGTGFAYVKGKWKFNSFTFNASSSDGWHDTKKRRRVQATRSVASFGLHWTTGSQQYNDRDKQLVPLPFALRASSCTICLL
ncbi:hypothetical protein PTSG_08207 [Salpingoeca rosetta]|uniref:Uncharacterized protein n=1 Tax=Salpingoeca rosetta (strain ATCC 50818 / BSB-021) TaxID=946362 RepID=F2UIB0_SALR5|nr:uncharacterized protein PTSG_08207 [Salpingoeca rosetta]EGD76859.1 hypothetical protein PTSG_08207 [Salpingoeca rosetta]|eukprot:XP_004991231.1 hypothetical protein PTSG_08207 [Salpingoeca rosetta]